LGLVLLWRCHESLRETGYVATITMTRPNKPPSKKSAAMVIGVRPGIASRKNPTAEEDQDASAFLGTEVSLQPSM
jgi:hypothetical protein